MVLMWPSTLMQLKVSLTASTSDCWADGFSSGASVRIRASMVAMLGPIIAAPFARPQREISRPPICAERPAILWIVSVVSMPRAAATRASSSAPNWPAAWAIPWAIFSMGKNAPITPVESTRAWSAAAWQAAAARRAISSASRRPRSPVQALALPELATTARIRSLGVRLRSKATGAA